MGNITELSQGSLNGLKKQVCECIENAYNKGYQDGKNEPREVKAVNVEDTSEYQIGYKVGYEDGQKWAIEENAQDHQEYYNNGYNNGLGEVNHAMTVLENMTETEREKWFKDYASVGEVVRIFTIQRIISSTKAYEEKKKKQAEEEIKVGDEVKHHNKLFIVTHTGTINCSVIDSDGRTGAFSKVVLEKTGKNVADKLQALFDDKAKGVEE